MRGVACGSSSGIPISIATRRIRSGCCARRRKRPNCHRDAEQRDELAADHSITSSARASSVGGTVEAEHFAVWGLIDQLELGGLHDRQVSGLGTLEDATGIDAGLAIDIGNVVAVAHQAAREANSGKHMLRVWRGEAPERNDPVAPAFEKGVA